jgi:hypothetical protein
MAVWCEHGDCGNYVVLIGARFVVLRRDTLEECHVFSDNSFIWPELYASSTGAVTIQGFIDLGDTGFHSMTVDNRNGTINYGCRLRAPYGDELYYRIRCSWGSLVYGHDAHEEEEPTNRIDVLDVDSSVSRCIRILDGHGVAELAATSKGVFFFMDDGEIQFHIGCDEIQCYYKNFV